MPAVQRARPLLTMLVVLLLGAGIGGAVAIPMGPRVTLEASALHPSSFRVTAETTTTTTTAPPATVAAVDETRDRPVDAPANSYANEPIREIGTIEIPKIGLVHRVMEGVTLRNIDLGPSHWPGTAMPGQPGNAVFAGHRVTHTHPFRDIDQLVPGDQVIFTIGGVRSVYVVTGHEVVRPSETGIVAQTATPTATLFACHPPHSATYRYVVHLALSTS